MTERHDGTSDEPTGIEPDATPNVDDGSDEGATAKSAEPGADFAGPEADTDEFEIAATPEPEPAAAPGPTQGSSAAAAGAGLGVPAAPESRRPMTPAERRAARARPAAPAGPTPSEQAVHIEDRASKLFVLVAVGAFVAVLLNALLLGNGGLLRPVVSPSPQPSVSGSPSPSAGSSASPSIGPSASPPVSPPASASPAPSASPAASGSPGASVAPSPSAS